MIKLIAPFAFLVDLNSSKERFFGRVCFGGEYFLKSLSMYRDTVECETLLILAISFSLIF